ncbi:MAG: EamA family transporter RarD, partial [Actinomyces bowdenii]|nr:EamA family transporter RarD [Actinomyces bowdenii]
QWLSLALAALAVGVLIVAYGSFPWISLGLALTFGFYSLLKKQAGARVDPLTGLTIETAAVTPVAGGYLLWLAATGAGTFNLPSLATGAGTLTWLLLAAGPVTALPLLLFAEGSRRVSLTVMGILQYIGPTLQFLVAVFLFHEHLPAARLWAVALVWLAVAVFVTDSLRARRRAPQRS